MGGKESAGRVVQLSQNIRASRLRYGDCRVAGLFWRCSRRLLPDVANRGRTGFS